MIRSAWAWVTVVLTVLVGFLYVSVVFLLTAPFDPGRYAAAATAALRAADG